MSRSDHGDVEGVLEQAGREHVMHSLVNQRGGEVSLRTSLWRVAIRPIPFPTPFFPPDLENSPAERKHRLGTGKRGA